MVPIGKSQDVRTDAGFLDITVGDPEVADVNPLTDHTLSILGKKIGTTRVSVYGAGKRLVGIFDIEVSYDISRLTNELKRRFPGSHIRRVVGERPHHAVGRSIGRRDAGPAVTIARQFGPEVINAVSVMSPQQVLLEVRFVEISRTAGRDLGFQWNGLSSKGVVNVGNRTPAANLPATSLPVAAAGVIFGRLAVRLRAGALGAGRHDDRHRDQRAGRAGRGAQPRRAQSRRAIRRHRELPCRRRIPDPGGRLARPDHRRVQEDTASVLPSRRPC